MLPGRLVRAASDILAEYDKFKISELLSTAAATSGQREQISDGQYVQTASDIRRQAGAIISTSRVEQYPQDLRVLVWTAP